jgi:hypothetical protein
VNLGEIEKFNKKISRIFVIFVVGHVGTWERERERQRERQREGVRV